ncbi:MAG: response regulator [Verrucomicrobiales bacterium]|nr:response regulator [Verrucomicrobiales bacterium]
MSSLVPGCPAPSTSPQLSASGSLPSRILVVEEDERLRDLSVGALLRAGYMVAIARDGLEGWQALCHNPFELLIANLDLPHLTGWELIRKVRNTPSRLPIILATGARPRRNVGGQPWLQRFATLLKPYSPAQLLLTVQEFLRLPEEAGLLVPVQVQEPVHPLPFNVGLSPGKAWRTSAINE